MTPLSCESLTDSASTSATLVNVVHDLTERNVGLRVLTGQGAAIDITTAAGKLVFGILAAVAEFARELISERTRAGLAAARARGRKGGRKPKMTPAKIRLAAAAWVRRARLLATSAQNSESSWPIYIDTKVAGFV